MRSSRPCRLSRCGPVMSFDLRDHADSRDVMRSSRSCRLSRCGPVTSFDLRDHADSRDVMRSSRPCRLRRCGPVMSYDLCDPVHHLMSCGLSDHTGSPDAINSDQMFVDSYQLYIFFIFFFWLEATQALIMCGLFYCWSANHTKDIKWHFQHNGVLKNTLF